MHRLLTGPRQLGGAAALLLLSISLLSPATLIAQLSDSQVAGRGEALLGQMTLDEKIGQITQVGPGAIGPNGPKPEDLIRRGRAGTVLWTIDSAQLRKMQEIAVKESRLKIPLLFGFDVIHGYNNIFPVPLAMARAQVLGFRGRRLGTPNHVVGSVKHFAGYGAAEGGRDYDGSYIPEELFRNVYLRPFQAAIDAGVGTVMSAYMDLNDVPASGNKWLLQDILRRDLGFRGFVISDAWAVASLAVHGYARGPEDAAYRGLTAGVNMDMGSETYLTHVAKLVDSAKLPVAVVDQAVREILAVKIRLGIFEHPYGDPAEKDKVLNDPVHRAAKRPAAGRSVVLLRNENNALPLGKTLASLAVIGPIADSAEEIKGSWSVEQGPAVSVVEGLRHKLPNARIEFVRGGDMQRLVPMPWDAAEGKKLPPLMPEAEMRKEVERAVDAAQRAEAVVLVLGERASMSGEAASRVSLSLPGNQQQFLEAGVAPGKPVVVG